MARERIYQPYGTTTYADTFLEITSVPDQGPVSIGVVPRDEKGAEDRMDAWFMDLDRDGCNRAIRELRKARDRCYGGDE